MFRCPNAYISHGPIVQRTRNQDSRSQTSISRIQRTKHSWVPISKLRLLFPPFLKSPHVLYSARTSDNLLQWQISKLCLNPTFNPKSLCTLRCYEQQPLTYFYWAVIKGGGYVIGYPLPPPTQIKWAGTSPPPFLNLRHPLWGEARLLEQYIELNGENQYRVL